MKGKRVLVTGSSRGIGKASALELARLGATVVVHGRAMSDELAATYQSVRAASPSSIMATADLARVGEIDALFERIAGQLEGLDALVNNAATQKTGALVDLAVEDWDQVLAVNLRAPFLCAQRAARLMRHRRQGGTILNISSVHAFDPRRNHGSLQHRQRRSAAIDPLPGARAGRRQHHGQCARGRRYRHRAHPTRPPSRHFLRHPGGPGWPK